MLILGMLAGIAVGADAATLRFVPSLDTTIFQETPNNSNGAGALFVAGRAGGTGTPAPLRRALLAFDLSAVGRGTRIEGASLSLTLTQSPSVSQVPVNLYRVNAAWGEAGSSAVLPGQGIFAATGDATWNTRAFAVSPAVPWIVAGGDYNPAPSSTALVGGLVGALPTAYIWMSDPQMVTDIQSWIDEPAANFGWIIVGNEAAPGTARQFASREYPVESYWPTLTVNTAPIPEPSTLLMYLAGLSALIPIHRRVNTKIPRHKHSRDIPLTAPSVAQWLGKRIHWGLN